MTLTTSPTNNRLTKLLGIRFPIMQAPLGGGISLAALAGAVSKAGGLGTLCLLPAEQMQPELLKAKEYSGGKPVAMNLLMPYVTRAHVDACEAAKPDVVSLFFGFNKALVARLKQAGIIVLHQVGTLEQANRALNDGADGLIVQGVEAGGHVIGKQALTKIMGSVREQNPEIPLLAAGALVDGESAKAILSSGADGISVGTRFLLTHESCAHTAYKKSLLQANKTLLTDLFGFGWTARHRVVPNQAIDRWTQSNGMARSWIHWFNLLGVASRRLPVSESRKQRVIESQRWSRPFFTPGSMTSAMRETHPLLAQSTALYAGEGVGQIDQLMSAAEVVAMFALAMDISLTRSG